MKLTKIHVDNFRLLKKLRLDLQDELSLVIDKNNCGKTSLLAVLNKFIGTKSTVNSFVWDDFSLSFKQSLYSMVTKEEITQKELSLFPMNIRLNLYINYDEKDDLSNISAVMMDLNPDTHTVVLEFSYLIPQDSFIELRKEYLEHIKKIRKKAESGNIEPIESEEFSIFMKAEHKKYFKIERYSREYDASKNDVTDNRAVIENEKIISKIINFKSISARRTVSNSDTNNTLSILSSEYYGHIEENEKQKQAIDNFKDVIGQTDKQLTKIYDDLFDDVVSKVKKFGGMKEGDSIIRILSTLQRRELLKGNTTVMYDHGDSNLLPENYNGLGYLNLIGMIFEIEVIMSDFRKDAKVDEKPADINLLFIEEPEAHTHPQMQYVFIKNIKEVLKANCYTSDGQAIISMQSIISTHSAHIVSESDFDDIKYFYIATDKYVYAKNMSDLELEYKKDNKDEDNMGTQRFKFLKQYLTLHRAELFFADKVIFIEGDTERILLPAIMRKIDQSIKDDTLPLLSQNISVIEAGAYSHVFSRFINFIGVKSLIITDIDPARLEIVLNNDGTQKVNKKDEPIKILRGCKASDQATTTTNAALKFFYSNILSSCMLKMEGESEKPIQTVFDMLCSIPLNKKVLVINADNSWQSSDSGDVFVAFQTCESDSKGTAYQASSFEDSFIHVNRQFVKDNMSVFQSLTHSEKFDDAATDAYDLANSCVAKKTSFAMEILLASNTEKAENKYSNWSIPHYIEEGLTWLRKQ